MTVAKLKETANFLKNSSDHIRRDGSRFIWGNLAGNPRDRALCLQKVFVGGSILLCKDEDHGFDKGFLGVGKVTLHSCRTDGSVLCSGSSFFGNEKGTGRIALGLDALDARLSIFLDEGFLAHGTVSLRGARTRQRLVCTKARFEKAMPDDNDSSESKIGEEREDYALFAKRIRVEGDAVICGTSLSDAPIRGAFHLKTHKSVVICIFACRRVHHR